MKISSEACSLYVYSLYVYSLYVYLLPHIKFSNQVVRRPDVTTALPSVKIRNYCNILFEKHCSVK